MSELKVSQDIISLAKFKAKASQVVRSLSEEQRRVVLTLNGQAAAVLVSPQDYDRLTERERFIQAIEAGLSDIKNGNVHSQEEVDELLEKEFGPL